MLADKSLQFDFPVWHEPKPPVLPEWLLAIGRAISAFLKFASPAAVYILWGLVLLALLGVLGIVQRELGYIDFGRRRAPPPEDVWLPAEAPARKLLAEADALAAQGQYAEAAHLLLLRSFEDIDARRPTLLTPAMTAREMALHPAVPPNARDMFAQIARTVEASLFGGVAMAAGGWQTCRSAYTDFARSREWI
jgi:hypothetical protein